MAAGADDARRAPRGARRAGGRAGPRRRRGGRRRTGPPEPAPGVAVLAPERRHRVLERRRACSVSGPSPSPRRRARADRAGKRPHEGDDAGQAIGDVVEVARVEAHLVAVAVGLDAGAVELPLHRRLAGARPRASATVGRWPPASAGSAVPTVSPMASSASARRRAARSRRPAGRSPASIAARRTTATGTSAALATASATSDSSAPWRSSPMSRRRSRSASGAVARPSRSTRTASRVATDPGPVVAGERVEGGVDLDDLEASGPPSAAPRRAWRPSPSRRRSGPGAPCPRASPRRPAPRRGRAGRAARRKRRPWRGGSGWRPTASDAAATSAKRVTAAGSRVEGLADQLLRPRPQAPAPVGVDGVGA